jgi:hypothetical protein
MLKTLKQQQGGVVVVLSEKRIEEEILLANPTPNVLINRFKVGNQNLQLVSR